jgi:hypothetical protein
MTIYRVNDAALRDVLPMLKREEFVEHTERAKNEAF